MVAFANHAAWTGKGSLFRATPNQQNCKEQKHQRPKQGLPCGPLLGEYKETQVSSWPIRRNKMQNHVLSEPSKIQASRSQAIFVSVPPSPRVKQFPPFDSIRLPPSPWVNQFPPFGSGFPPFAASPLRPFASAFSSSMRPKFTRPMTFQSSKTCLACEDPKPPRLRFFFISSWLR